METTSPTGGNVSSKTRYSNIFRTSVACAALRTLKWHLTQWRPASTSWTTSASQSLAIGSLARKIFAVLYLTYCMKDMTWAEHRPGRPGEQISEL